MRNLAHTVRRTASILFVALAACTAQAFADCSTIPIDWVGDGIGVPESGYIQVHALVFDYSQGHTAARPSHLQVGGFLQVYSYDGFQGVRFPDGTEISIGGPSASFELTDGNGNRRCVEAFIVQDPDNIPCYRLSIIERPCRPACEDITVVFTGGSAFGPPTPVDIQLIERYSNGTMSIRTVGTSSSSGSFTLPGVGEGNGRIEIGGGVSVSLPAGGTVSYRGPDGVTYCVRITQTENTNGCPIIQISHVPCSECCQDIVIELRAPVPPMSPAEEEEQCRADIWVSFSGPVGCSVDATMLVGPEIIGMYALNGLSSTPQRIGTIRMTRPGIPSDLETGCKAVTYSVRFYDNTPGGQVLVCEKPFTFSCCYEWEPFDPFLGVNTQ